MTGAGIVALVTASVTMVAAALAMVQHERRVRAPLLVLGLVIQTALAATCGLTLGVSLEAWAVALLVCAGAAAGIPAGRLTRLRLHQDSAVGHVARLPVVFLLALAGLQSATAVASTDWMAIAYAVLIAAVAFTASATALVLGRSHRLRSREDARLPQRA